MKLIALLVWLPLIILPISAGLYHSATMFGWWHVLGAIGVLCWVITAFFLITLLDKSKKEDTE